MILSILFAVLGYRKAEATGRNKILWAILMVVIFIGVQVIAGIFVGVVLGFGVFTLGWSESIFQEYYWPISLAGVLISAAVCSGVLYILGRKSVEDESSPPAPDQYGLE